MSVNAIPIGLFAAMFFVTVPIVASVTAADPSMFEALNVSA